MSPHSGVHKLNTKTKQKDKYLSQGCLDKVPKLEETNLTIFDH